MKKFWASPWTIGIGTSFIGFLFTVIYDLVKDKSIFSTIWSIIKWIWNLIISFLNFNIKVWWLLIGIAVLFLVLFLIAKYYDFKNENENSAGFLKYTKDTIQGWSWDWNWQKDWSGKYDVEKIKENGYIQAMSKFTAIQNAEGVYRLYNSIVKEK